jgi:hypothetical protein
LTEAYYCRSDEDKDVDEDLVDRMGKMKSLYGRQLLTKDEARVLMQLLGKETPKLMAAFDVYDSINDEEDLVDTIKRIARHYSREEEDEEDSGGQEAAKETSEAVEELLLRIVSGRFDYV